jgi:tRNA (adenine22-N1)-methyltransferase
MKLLQSIGPRLDSIFSLIAEPQVTVPYDCIWDCCCDHGYLGRKMLQHKLAETVCFVDQVSHITEKLSVQLEKEPSGNYQVHTGDAGELFFSGDERHLVIIAGVTGNNVITIIQAILDNLPSMAKHQPQIDFIACPTRGSYDVRSFMITRNCSLKGEFIISEKGRQYEVIYISAPGNTIPSSRQKPISAVGNMWDGKCADHGKYIDERIRHYQRESQAGGRLEAKSALASYQAIKAARF